MKTLKDARVGETVTVSRLHGEGAVKRRIMDMGITRHRDLYPQGSPPGGPHGAERAGLRAVRA